MYNAERFLERFTMNNTIYKGKLHNMPAIEFENIKVS